MKKYLSVIFAGMIGGFLATAIFLQYAVIPKMNALQTEVSAAPAQLAKYTPEVPLSTTRTAIAPFDFKAAAAKAMPAVVHISAAQTSQANRRGNDQGQEDPFRFFFGDPNTSPFERKGTGSGVILSEDGYIVTNNHVIEFADEVEVTLNDNRKFRAQIVGTDEQTDLALLKIDARGLPTMEYADSDQAEVGEWVLAVGNPFDLTSTVTAGIISAKGRDIDIISGNRSIEAFIQTDAAVNPGNSGGALVTADGKLLGINTAIATRTGSYAGYSFAIPVRIMSRIIEDLKDYGIYQRPFLGINITELDNDRANDLGINITRGVVVESLVQGGAAEKAGLRAEDVIVGVENRDVNTVPELLEVIGRAKVGDRLALVINRGGNTRNIDVKLQAE